MLRYGAGYEESDTTERLHFHFSLSCIGEGNGNPLRFSCLENPRDGGAWWAAVYGVAQSRTRLKRGGGGQAMIAGPRRSAPAKQSLCLSWCLRSSGRLSPIPRRSWRRRPRRAPSSDGGRDPAQASDPQADPAAAGRGLSGGGEHGRDRAQGGGCHQCLGGQVRTAAPSAASRGGTGRRSPKPASGAVPPRRREGESACPSFYSNAHPAGAGVQPHSRRCCVAPGRGAGTAAFCWGLLGWRPPGPGWPLD